MPSPLRILIADDAAGLRVRIREAIADELPGVELGEASSAAEVLAKVATEKWDLVVLDIQMPGPNGLDALAALKASRPELPVVIMSLLPEERYAESALRGGAVAFIPKEKLPERLVATIRAALSLAD